MSNEICSQFLAAMRHAGFEPDCDIIADGKLHRFRDWLDRPGKRNGWYVLFPDYPPSGAFGCWKRGISLRWPAPQIRPSYHLRKRFLNIDHLLAAEHEISGRRAIKTWHQALPANGRHSYLAAKKVGAHGLRYHKGALLVPVMDLAGELHGIQRIFRDGKKCFTFATKKRGHFFMIGTPVEQAILLCVGYATAATLHEVSGHAAAVAFDCGNLRHVAEVLRAAWPDYRIYVCGDDDHLVPGNPGVTAATEAARAVHGTLLMPRFPYDRTAQDSDFNDLFRLAGTSAVLECLGEAGGRHV